MNELQEKVVDAIPSRDSVVEKLIELFRQEVNEAPVDLSLETRFDEVEIESIDLINLLFRIEDEYDITLEVEQNEMKATTLSDMVDQIMKLLEANRTD